MIWQISPGGAVIAVAGVAFTCGFGGDGGPATQAELNTPVPRRDAVRKLEDMRAEHAQRNPISTTIN